MDRADPEDEPRHDALEVRQFGSQYESYITIL